jgi:hypothetical protein
MQVDGATLTGGTSWEKNGVVRQSGPRVGAHYFDHGRHLAAVSSYKTPITLQCKSKADCDTMQAKLKSPTFTAELATSANIPASAIKSISEPQSYETKSAVASTTTLYGTEHKHKTTTTTIVIDNDEKWKNSAIALAVVCVLLLVAVVALALGGKKSSGGAVKSNNLEQALGQDEEAV